MADSAPVVHIGENSPEYVAFKLMLLIGDVEARETYGHGEHPMDREWILKTYDQCRDVVNGVGRIETTLDHFRPASHSRPRAR